MVRVCVLDAGLDAGVEEAQQVAQPLGAILGRVGKRRVVEQRGRVAQRRAELIPEGAALDAFFGVGQCESPSRCGP